MTTRINVFTFGDSLTQGYNGFFGSGVPRPYAINLEAVANRSAEATARGVTFRAASFGFPGYTSEDLVETLTGLAKANGKSGEDALADDPRALPLLFDYFDVFCVMAGTNDLADNNPRIFDDISSMVDIITTHRTPGRPKPHIVLLSLPEAAMEKNIAHVAPLANSVSAALQQLVSQSAADHRRRALYFCDARRSVPYWGATEHETGQWYGEDGLHLSPAGYDRLGAAVADLITTKVLPNVSQNY